MNQPLKINCPPTQSQKDATNTLTRGRTNRTGTAVTYLVSNSDLFFLHVARSGFSSWTCSRSGEEVKNEKKEYFHHATLNSDWWPLTMTYELDLYQGQRLRCLTVIDRNHGNTHTADGQQYQDNKLVCKWKSFTNTYHNNNPEVFISNVTFTAALLAPCSTQWPPKNRICSYF